MSRPELRLRPFLPGDESAALAAHQALRADGFDFLLFHEPTEPWTRYLGRLEANRLGQRIGPMAVPASFLAAVAGGALVGRISIRHALDDWLSLYAGHIGYGVVPEYRRRGYGTEMLRQGLIIARAAGVERVLVTCEQSNLASARTIEACDGRFESSIDNPDTGMTVRRYWIA